MMCRHCEPGQVEKREILQATLHAVRGESEPATYAGAFGLLNYHIAHLIGREPLLASKLVSPTRRRIVV